jgi:MFS family permease
MLVCAVASAGLVFLFAEQHISNSTQTSRLATIEALVTQRTFSIDVTKESWQSRDIAMVNGHYYSPKSPLLSYFAANVYRHYARHTGATFVDKSATIYFFSLLIGFLPHVFLLIYLFLFLEIWIDDMSARTWAYSSVCFGYLGFGYATTINNVTPTAALLLAALYHAYRVRSGISQRGWHFFLSGVYASVAASFDPPSSIYVLALFLYLSTHKPFKSIFLFALGALPCLLFAAHLNHVISGSYMPLQSMRAAFHFKGSYWMQPVGIDALWEPKWLYAFNVLFGHHGVFAMTPILIFGVIYGFSSLLRRDAYWRETLLILGAACVQITFYIFYTKNYGGHNVGFRWLMPIMPPLLLLTARWLASNVSRGKRVVFFFALIVSTLNALDALDNAWKESSRWAQIVYRVVPLSNPVYFPKGGEK